MDVWELLRDGIVLGVVLLGWGAAVVVIRRRWRDIGTSPDAVALVRRHSVCLEIIAACVLWVAVTVPPMFLIGLIGYPVRLLGHQLAALPMGGIVVVATLHLVGAAVWPQRTTPVRAAGLNPRTSNDITSRYARRLMHVWLATLVGVSIGLGLMASGLRVVSRVVDSYSAQTTGPWPGWLWTVPLLIGAAIVLLVIHAAIRAIAAQPAFDMPRAQDLVIRRRLAGGLLRSAALVFGLSVAGLTLVAGGALQQLGSGLAVDVQSMAPGTTSPAHQIAGTLLVLLSFVIAVGAAISACWPERRAARSAPAVTAAAVS